jgi:peptidoglycan/LPS O-acetylase OafA/YrhL
MPRPSGELRALTGLRFFAALGVVLCHMPHTRAAPWLRPVAPYLAEGFVGVPFFFILSGFVLTFAYHGRFGALTAAGLRRYFAARIARVYPLHLLTLGLALCFPFVAAADVAGPAWEGLRLAVNALLLQGLVPNPAYYAVYNGVAWSLSCEVVFYLLLPFLLRASARRAGRPAVWVAAAVGVVAWQLWFAGFTVRHSTRAASLWVCFLPVVAHLPEFLTGVCLGRAFVASRADRTDADRPSWKGTAAELAAVLALAALVGCSGRVQVWYRLNGSYTPAMALVVWVFAHQRGRLSRLLAGRAFVFLGEVSFSLYMLHCLVLARALAWGPGGLPPAVLEGVGLLVSVGLSVICYRGFESPLRHSVTRLLAGDDVRESFAPPALDGRRAA